MTATSLCRGMLKVMQQRLRQARTQARITGNEDRVSRYEAEVIRLARTIRQEEQRS